MDFTFPLLDGVDPFFKTNDCVIYNMDCITGMRSLLGESEEVGERPSKKARILRPIALTVTSPPYNIGKEYENIMDFDKYILWCEQWMKCIHSLTTDTGAFWLNLGYAPIPKKGKAVPLPYLLWDKSQFFLQQEVIWKYGAGVACRNSFSPRNEKFLWYVKDSKKYTFNLDAVRDPNVKYPNQKKNGKLRCNPLGKNPTDVWDIPKVTSGAQRASAERTKHPAQFPEAVIERIIKACSNHGDVILDPFLGSGTVAAVALRLGRRVIGFEIDESYCNIAKNRLEAFTIFKN